MKKTPSDDIYLETIRKRRKPHPSNISSRNKKYRESLDPNSPSSRFSSFMRQDVGSNGFGIIPPQYTGIVLLGIFLLIPKLLGMGFFFFYVSKGESDLYASVHTGGTLLDWAIGYEILAVIILLFIGKYLLQALLD
jgi:hypothetical protein